MRGAPPVRMACAGGLRWRGLHAAVWAAAAGGVAAWAALRLELGSVAAASVFGALLGSGLAWSTLGRRDCGDLAWDGRHWTLDGQAGRPQVMVDLGSWMLVRFDPGSVGACRRWLPAALMHCGAPAHRCRAALRATEAVPQGAATPDG